MTTSDIEKMENFVLLEWKGEMQFKPQQDISHPPDWQKLTSLAMGALQILDETIPPSPAQLHWQDQEGLQLQMLRRNQPFPQPSFLQFWESSKS